MDTGWFIGHKRIPPSKSEQQMSSSYSSVSRPSMTINLTEMLRADKPNAVKKPIPIRPPSPRVSLQKDQECHRRPSCEPMPKSIIRQRSHSLPSTTEKKKQCRNVGVRFVDSLGLDLEDIKLFKSGEDPFVPHHVTFRLLMGAELADGRHLEISSPYMKPYFSQQPGDQPGFLHRLYWKSCTETKASWVSSITNTWEGGGQLSCDTFRFHLPVPPFLQPGAVLEFAIQYKVCGAEYWDNNDGQNYKLVCHNYKLTVPKECKDSMVHFI
ncbi:protein phosphatase 1, regulatory subunit 3Da isoform X2 [Toxotes jaculatrix]|uniref:protein phosphatase 1, regulatory subunit 3Da isoform X2 n=1 Tax=Toxotes jaculatrix TaxID=941984 RepID=UPI001B3AF1E8|nr:protein phosphatase 1, regulatory subunit 3Da isoform X2 [Toxotes jaculatrix]